MRTIIYVDGFNLYFRLLVNRPAAKWLNIKALSEKLLDPANVVTGVKYYTARVSGRIDSTAPGRQQIYLDALRTVPFPSVGEICGAGQAPGISPSYFACAGVARRCEGDQSRRKGQ
jgi:hypothetical protein